MKISNSESTRKKIINATLTLFVKKGYHGTSISNIANATKITKGAIYFHFTSKYELLKGILEEYERAFLDQMIKEVRSSEGKAIDKIKTYLRFSINFAAKNQDLVMCHANLATELCSSNKKYEKEIKKIYEKYYKFIADLLEEGKEDGSLRKDINPGILAINLIGGNEGNLVQWSFNKNNMSKPERFSRSYMKFFLNGICKHK
jgi:AcrR family transcriptional regulator